MNATTGTIGLLGPAAMLLMITGTACAQSAPTPAPSGSGGYSRPLSGRVKVAQQEQQPEKRKEKKSKSVMNMTRTDDSGVYCVTIEGDELTATIDGQELADERIQREDRCIKLLDDHGQIVAEFQVSQDPYSGGDWKSFGGTAWAAPQGYWGVEAPAEGMVGLYSAAVAGQGGDGPPPVMLGITMGEPSETLLEHLGIDKESAVLIDHVYEGLPADEAGMQDADILIEFDGQKGLTEGKVREILRSKEPGDGIKAVVVRKGATKDLKIKLKAYDAEKLGGVAVGQGGAFSPQEVEGLKLLEGHDPHKAIQDALKSLEKTHGMEADAVREYAHKALKDALKGMEQDGKMYRQLQFSPRAFSGAGGEPGGIVVGPGPGQVFNVPGQPSAPGMGGGRNSDLSRQMEELRAQLNEVQRSRDELKQQLDEIKSMLRDMRDRGSR